MAKLNLSVFSWKRAVPIFLFLLFAIALVVILILTGRDPQVYGITPGVVGPGDQLVISGRFFGEQPGGVRLAGREVPLSAFTTWSEEEISLVVPEGTDSGLLFVDTDGGASDGLLFQMVASVPHSRDAAYTPGAPQMTGLRETEVRIGAILVIEGKNFGAQRRSSVVEFSGYTDEGIVSPMPESVSYPVWTDGEIHVRVPSAVTSGLVSVATEWGRSNPMRLAIDRPAGQMLRAERSEIALRYGVSVSGTATEDSDGASPGWGDVVVWLPEPVGGLAQTDVRYLEKAVDDETRVYDGRELSAVRFEDLEGTFVVDVQRTVVADRHGVTLDIDPSRVSAGYEDESGFYSYYTRALPELPADNEELREVAASVRRNRASPYQIARVAYDWILSRMDYALYAEPRDALSGFQRAYGDYHTYATLYVSVLRAAGIPARVVTGVLASGEGDAYPHFWCEFFVSAIGWIPVDPALGDGAFPAGFPEPEDPVAFYFGNLDSYRLAFAHGYTENGPDRRDAPHTSPAGPYSLQRSHVEMGLGIQDASVRWLDPVLLSLFSW